MPLYRMPTRRLGRLGAAVAVINGSSSYVGAIGTRAPKTTAIATIIPALASKPITPAVATPVVTPTNLVPPPSSAPVVTSTKPVIVSPVNPALATPISIPVIAPTMPVLPSGGVNYLAIAGAAGKLTGNYATGAINYIAGTSFNFGGSGGGYGGAYAALLNAVIPAAPPSSAAGQLSSTLGEAGTALTVLNTTLNTIGWSNPFTAVAAVVLDVAEALANVIGNTHPQGYDQFVLIKPNGAGVMLDNETPNAGDVRTTAWANAYVQGFGAVVTALVAHGYTLTYPAQIIEIRDDGATPAELHTNVIPMTAAEQAQYNLPGGYKGDSTWNDRDPSNYQSLGPPGNLTAVVQTWLQWVIKNGYIKAPVVQPLVNPQPAPVQKPIQTAPPTIQPVAPVPKPVQVAPPIITPTAKAPTNLSTLYAQATATGAYAYTTPPPAVQTPTSTTGKKMSYGGFYNIFGSGSSYVAPSVTGGGSTVAPASSYYSGAYSLLGGSYAGYNIGGAGSASYAGGYNPTASYMGGGGTGSGGYGGLLSAAGGIALGLGTAYAQYAQQKAYYKRQQQYAQQRQQRVAAYRQARIARIRAARQARQQRIIAARQAAVKRRQQIRLLRLQRLATGG